jgi:hypothetical protein
VCEGAASARLQVTSRSLIAKKYARTWLVVDLVSVLPIEALPAHNGTAMLGLVKFARLSRVGKVLQLVKGYRLLRVTKLPRLIAVLEMYMDG